MVVLHFAWSERSREAGDQMAKAFTEGFYGTRAWKKCRAGYTKSVGGLCERCLKRGRIVPGEIVHHKTALTPENIHDESVTLNWENLELLCRECHAEEHADLEPKRWSFGDDGGLWVDAPIEKISGGLP